MLLLSLDCSTLPSIRTLYCWVLIVTIKKTDGDIRICCDFKIGVYHQICSDLFPLLSIETASHELANMKHFAKIDLKSAYKQIEIDDKSKEIIALNTPMGFLRWSRLPFGIKTASYIFRRAIEKISSRNVDNIIIYQDIFLGACTREELKSKTERVLRRLKQAGMTINRDKCKLECEKIFYQGYQISRVGISPDERLTSKIPKMEKPTKKKELESFLGLIDFCCRYLPRYGELTEPFIEMRKKRWIYMDVEAI